jgi:hypothetical protein
MLSSQTQTSQSDDRVLRKHGPKALANKESPLAMIAT